MEPQKISNCQSNPEKKEQNRRYNSPRLQTILQSYSNQNSMVLAQKWTQRSMEQKQSPQRNPQTYSQSMTKEARIYNGENTFSSTSGTEKTGQPHVKQ